MGKITACFLMILALIILLSTACGADSGGKGRVVEIVQTDEACTPSTIAASPGEKLTLKVRNDGKKDREIEGIEGTKLEEVKIPAGRTRSADFTTQKKAGVQKIKCYVPDGSTTVLSVTVGG